MKHRTRWTTIIAFIMACSLTWTSQTFAVEDAIIAVVNDELITLKDLKDYARSTYVGLVAEGVDDAQIRAIMGEMETNGIDKLIEDKLILSKANTIGLDVREELVEERVAEMKHKYGSEQNLVDALISAGATLTDLKNKIRDQMKIKFIVDHEVKSKLYVNPQEVTDFYEKNKNQFNQSERINLESIFIAYGDDKMAASEKANKALKQIENGKDFKEVAEEYSEAPSVGIVERNQLLPVIEETVFNLETDEISSLVEVDTGIYIFKLKGKNAAKIANLENVKKTIYDLLYKEKFRKHFLRWLKELKNEAYIEIKQ